MPINPDYVNALADRLLCLKSSGKPVLIAIDGRCASGKTTLADKVSKLTACNVFHTDSFFLPPKKRTAARLSLPDGNIDSERLETEVIMPILSDNAFSYRPYSCKSGGFCSPVQVTPAPVNIIEGSYSCCRQLFDYYDLRVFMTTTFDKQLERIAMRNGEGALKAFIDRWIPLEEKYFSALNIQEQCDICFET